MNMSRKNKSERFRLLLPCKGYVKAYLLSNFNRPDEDWPEIVNLSSDKTLHDLFVRMLSKNDCHYDKRTKCSYRYTVSIEITYDQFRRYGWMLSTTDTMTFNKILEHRVKNMLYSFVSTFRMTGMPISECIIRFRRRTRINEFDWDTDSIRKDLQRHLNTDFNALDDFYKKIEEKVWCTLSQSGTITEQGKEEYEKDYI